MGRMDLARYCLAIAFIVVVLSLSKRIVQKTKSKRKKNLFRYERIVSFETLSMVIYSFILLIAIKSFTN